MRKVFHDENPTLQIISKGPEGEALHRRWFATQRGGKGEHAW